MRELYKLAIVLIAGVLFALFVTAERDVENIATIERAAEDTKNVVVSETAVTARLWNPRGKSDELIAERARFLAQAAETRTAKQKEADKAYMERYKEAIVINSLMPTSVGITGNTIESFVAGIERNRRAGVTHVSASVGAFHPEELINGFIRDTDPVVIMLDLEKVQTTKDIRDAKAENRMTITYNSQGFDDKMKDLGYVGSLHDKGVKIMNFVYNIENHLATGINFNSEPDNKRGITDLGKAFIKLANERGIIVDVSHSSDAAVIGKQGTCYGSDFTHNLEDAMFMQLLVVDKYPPEKGFGMPSQMASIEDIWAIVAVLEDKYKWNEEKIRGFLDENILRVYEANWE